MPENEPTETVVENPTPAPSAPIELPADHPLVKALAAQKLELKELRESQRRLNEIEDSQKTEAQRLAEAAAKAQRDADDAKAETIRYRVAATHGVGADYFDLLGSGDEDAISGRAERISGLLKLADENAALRSEIEALKQGKPSPASQVPVPHLKPGATPEPDAVKDDSYPSSWLPKPRGNSS